MIKHTEDFKREAVRIALTSGLGPSLNQAMKAANTAMLETAANRKLSPVSIQLTVWLGSNFVVVKCR